MSFSRLATASRVCRIALPARQYSESSVESVFPKSSVWKEIDKDSLPPLPKLDADLLRLLEEQSLVRFDDKAALWHLEKAIEYANQLHAVDTENIEPMYTLLEDEAAYLRDDDGPSEMVDRTELLRNAAVTCEGYFVAPPDDYSMYGRTAETSNANGYDPNFLQSLQAAVQQVWASQGESSTNYGTMTQGGPQMGYGMMAQGEPSASYGMAQEVPRTGYGMTQAEQPTNYAYGSDPYSMARVYG